MNDDARRVDAALVRIAQLGPEDPVLSRRLLCDGGDQRARELRGGQARHRRGVGGVDRAHQLPQALALLRRDHVALGEAQKSELPLQVRLDALAHLPVGLVPLVHRDHDGAPALQDVAGDVRILIGHAVGRIEHQHGDVRRFDRLQRLDDGEALDGLPGRFSAPAQPCSVDQGVAPAAALEGHLDRVPGGPRLVEGDDALLAHQRVHQRGFADVRAADDGHPRMALLGSRFGFRVIRKLGEDGLHELAHAFAMRRRDGGRHAQAELVKFRGRRLGRHAFGLVDDHPDANLELA